jgi:hypothetical protein
MKETVLTPERVRRRSASIGAKSGSDRGWGGVDEDTLGRNEDTLGRNEDTLGRNEDPPAGVGRLWGLLVPDALVDVGADVIDRAVRALRSDLLCEI